MERINIAIDGPAGAGKSTVARIVAQRLGFVYVDTGAMYRAITWKVLSLGLTTDQTDLIVKMARETQLKLIPGQHGQIVLVDGQDVSVHLRNAQVTSLVSSISQIPEIRELLVLMQQQLAVGKGIVMDGRDIGTHVLPNAEVKIYLTASVRERASRRYEEIKQNQPGISMEQLVMEISERDRMDQERKVSPLRRAKDAVLLDASEMNIQQVCDRILEISMASVGKGV